MVLHPQAEAALAQWARGPHVTDPGFGQADIDRQRRLAVEEAAAEPKEDVDAVEDVDADGVPCRWYRPGSRQARPTGVVVFLHGGGFVFGDLDTHDAQARRVANRTGLGVLAVGYRRPPEHRFPAAPDDVDTALAWLTARAPDLGVDTARLVALGDSAGGNLALVAALRNPGAFAATVLVYPFIDPRLRFPSHRDDDGGLMAGEAAWYWRQYAASPADYDDPDLAPIDSDRLGTLPATLVVAAEHDILVDENVELVRRARQAGADLELSTYPGMVHGFWRQPALFDAATDSLDEIAAFVGRVWESG